MPNRDERLDYAEKVRINDVYIIIENIWYDHNVSAIFRTVECAGLKNVFIAGAITKKKIKHNHIDFKAHKFLNIEYFEEIGQAVAAAKSKGCRIFATYMSDDSNNIWATEFKGPVAIILGAEKQGISKEALALAEEKIWIPTLGLTRSLNVSVSNGIIIYEIIRQKRFVYNEVTAELKAPFMKFEGDRS